MTDEDDREQADRLRDAWPSLSEIHDETGAYTLSNEAIVTDRIWLPFDRFDRIYVDHEGARYEVVVDGGGLTVVEADE